MRLYVPVLQCASSAADAMLSWIAKQEGIKSVRVNYDCASVTIEYAPSHFKVLQSKLDFLARLNPEGLVAFLETMQQAANQSGGPLQAEQQRPETERLMLPTASFGLAVLANPWAATMNVPLILYNSLPVFRRAWLVWSREGRLNVDFLDALAIAASLGRGQFVTASLITWLIRLGDWIRDLTAAGPKRAVSELLEFQNKTAWIVRDGEVVQIPATELAAGDMVAVYPGEMIPVDGEILKGHALIDQKTITGEGLPVSRGVGDMVFAASILCEGQLVLRTARAGIETTAGQIAHLVTSAPVGDTRTQNHAERFADRLVMPSLGLASGTALLTGDLNRSLSLVIVDYGTGIRVAAPTAVLSAMTCAARNGILFKSGGHMEKLAAADTVVFDKTGTLSHGVPHIVDVLSYNKFIASECLLSLAAGTETRLHHPVAEALREKVRELGEKPPHCDETLYRPGLGVEGRVNGYYMHVGSERFLRESNIKVAHAAADRAGIDERGCSSLYIAVDGKLAGLVAYEDCIRPESRKVIETLYGIGIRDAIMLTGDDAAVASAVGRRLGLTQQIANLLPSCKAEIVQQLRREGRRVAVVGDGINDSPALRFADAGIAMKHSPDIALESADVVLLEDSLWKLVQAIEVSRWAIRLIKQNYGIVAAMNTAALGLCVPGGLVSPWFTAMISNGSAIVASLNGLRPLLKRNNEALGSEELCSAAYRARLERASDSGPLDEKALEWNSKGRGYPSGLSR